MIHDWESQVCDVVTLESGIQLPSEQRFNGDRLTCCGRRIAPEKTPRRGVLGHVTCLECLAANGVPRLVARDYLRATSGTGQEA